MFSSLILTKVSQSNVESLCNSHPVSNRPYIGDRTSSKIDTVPYDCKDALKPVSAVDIQNYEKLEKLSPIFSEKDIIRKAMQNKF